MWGHPNKQGEYSLLTQWRHSPEDCDKKTPARRFCLILRHVSLFKDNNSMEFKLVDTTKSPLALALYCREPV